MHQSSFDKMKQFKEKYLDKAKPLKILDVGSLDINGSYASLFQEVNWEYFGADMIDGNNVDILLKNPYDWADIDSNFYDVVISGQSFEHIEYFWITSLQINRVLKKGGLVCIIAPAGGYEHRYPLDCWRYYPDGMISIAKWSKMDVLEVSTQWANQNYKDESDLWMDTLLICKKNEEIPQINEMIKKQNDWMFLIGNNTTNERKNIDVKNIKYVKEKQLEIFTKNNFSKNKSNNEWFNAISSLLEVYSNRTDLQNTFPGISKGGSLKELLQWAVDFGIKEDKRLFQYYEFYKKICYSSN